ncbi:sulfatase [Thraustotheca clavata]|uniref:Sulfatase n=1 Tax=Thraustotheca clavata TaxID=74557 RepID=A0A1V9ZNT2_9STRA|nr:sulfatase [Thraustotheca clavata]
MVTLAQVGITLIAGSYLIGRKDLPRVAKAGGNYVGRTVGAVLRAKNQYFEATKDSEIVKMQAELQKGLEELNNIRSELSTVSSMKRPMRPVGTISAVPRMSSSTLNQTSHVATATATATYNGNLSRPPVAQPMGEVIDHTDRRYEEVIENAENPDQARLALAELNMTKQKQYTTHIESIEGGADYIASSLMDTILLKRVDEHPSNAKNPSPVKE